MRIEGCDIDVNGFPNRAFEVKIQNGVLEKIYQFDPVEPQYLGAYEDIQVFCMDLTHDGEMEYVIRYIRTKGTGIASYEMKIIDAGTLELIPVFDKAEINKDFTPEPWTGDDVFTDEQLEKVNRIIGEMKLKDEKLSWWKEIDNEYGLLYFVATPALIENQACIRLDFSVPVENEPVPLGEFTAFLTYDTQAREFVVNDEIQYISWK